MAGILTPEDVVRRIAAAECTCTYVEDFAPCAVTGAKLNLKSICCNKMAAPSQRGLTPIYVCVIYRGRLDTL
jgi:hypothetical protein